MSLTGICGFTINPTPTVWQVNLINWSIWLTIAWVGWWAAMLVAMAAPHVLKHTIGQIAPEARHYIDYLFALKKTLSAALWTLAMWISFQPLILSQGPADRSTGAGLTLSQMTKGLFAFWICAVILLVEKLIIQVRLTPRDRPVELPVDAFPARLSGYCLQLPQDELCGSHCGEQVCSQESRHALPQLERYWPFRHSRWRFRQRPWW